MSILKGIMHHWNKTKNDYDIIHPETDYKKITDWNEGIVATLASTALGTLVSTLTSDSLLATMIQKVLTATGVKYNIAQNGYVCFGSLFGNIIIHWVFSAQENKNNKTPLSGFTKLFETAIHKTGGTATYITSMRDTDDNSFYIASNASGTSSSYWVGIFK